MYTSLAYYFGLGDLLRERNDLEAAERHLAQGMVLVKETLTVEPFVAVLGYSALARLEQARGNTHEAFATLDELVQLASLSGCAAASAKGASWARLISQTSFASPTVLVGPW